MPTIHRRAAGALLAFAAFAATDVASAAIYCVRNESELQQALNDAAASGNDDEIRIREGAYTAFSQSFRYTATTTGWLVISGGWTTVDGVDCVGQGRDASRTILEGAGQRSVLRITHLAAEGATRAPSVFVQNLSLRNGRGDEAAFERGGALDVSGYSDHYMEIRLDNLIVADSSGYFGGGANLYVKNGVIRVLNSLFAGNRSETVATGHLTTTVVATEAGTSPAVTIANSTFVGGRCPGQGSRGCGVSAGLPEGVRLDVVNSLFFDNEISDLNIEGMSVIGLGNGEAHADHSLIGTVSGNLPLDATNLLSGDPRFVDAANGDYRLRDDSPFINQGLAAVPLTQPPLAHDLGGSPRTRFGAMDPGAYENQTWDFIFRDGFGD